MTMDPRLWKLDIIIFPSPEIPNPHPFQGLEITANDLNSTRYDNKFNNSYPRQIHLRHYKRWIFEDTPIQLNPIKAGDDSLNPCLKIHVAFIENIPEFDHNFTRLSFSIYIQACFGFKAKDQVNEDYNPEGCQSIELECVYNPNFHRWNCDFYVNFGANEEFLSINEPSSLEEMSILLSGSSPLIKANASHKVSTGVVQGHGDGCEEALASVY